MGIIHWVPAFLKAFLGGRAALAAENLALRHQLAVARGDRTLATRSPSKPASWRRR